MTKREQKNRERMNAMIGRRFGKLVVISHVDGTPNNVTTGKWLCKCDCGNTTIVSGGGLTKSSHGTISCGCEIAESKHHRAEITEEKVIATKRFGRLTVINKIGGCGANALWNCRCDCGRYRNVISSRLLNGSVTDCGLFEDKESKAYTNKQHKHRLSTTVVYQRYIDLIKSCYRPTSSTYGLYRKLGIHMCQEWYTPEEPDVGMMRFIEWSYANGYYDQPKDTPKSDTLTIELSVGATVISPDTIRWVPVKNRRRVNPRQNLFIYDNEYHTASEAKADIGLDKTTTRNHRRKGWSDAAIVYSAIHPELCLYRDEFGSYHDREGFMILIPKNPSTIEGDVRRDNVLEGAL